MWSWELTDMENCEEIIASNFKRWINIFKFGLTFTIGESGKFHGLLERGRTYKYVTNLEHDNNPYNGLITTKESTFEHFVPVTDHNSDSAEYDGENACKEYNALLSNLRPSLTQIINWKMTSRYGYFTR